MSPPFVRRRLQSRPVDAPRFHRGNNAVDPEHAGSSNFRPHFRHSSALSEAPERQQGVGSGDGGRGAPTEDDADASTRSSARPTDETDEHEPHPPSTTVPSLELHPGSPEKDASAGPTPRHPSQWAEESRRAADPPRRCVVRRSSAVIADEEHAEDDGEESEETSDVVSDTDQPSSSEVEHTDPDYSAGDEEEDDSDVEPPAMCDGPGDGDIDDDEVSDAELAAEGMDEDVSDAELAAEGTEEEDQGAEDLTEYERERLARIARNLEVMERLGIPRLTRRVMGGDDGSESDGRAQKRKHDDRVIRTTDADERRRRRNRRRACATPLWYDDRGFHVSAPPALRGVEDDDDPCRYVGHSVRKQFRGRWYQGRVVSYVAPYWKVMYDDGDVEEMSLGELKRVMVNARTNTRLMTDIREIDVDALEDVWVLDLFSGTQSVAKAAAKMTKVFRRGRLTINVVSMDYETVKDEDGNVFVPTVLGDVTDWRVHLSAYLKERFRPGMFDVIWASPDCRFFSGCNNQTKTAGNVQRAREVVRAARDCIEFFNPPVWFIENPWGSDLRDDEMMEDIREYRHLVSYCHYGRLYKKNTCIWTNLIGLRDVRGYSLLRQCTTESPCPMLHASLKVHVKTAQQGPNAGDPAGMKRGVVRTEAYRVPEQLLIILLSKTLLQLSDLRLVDGEWRTSTKVSATETVAGPEAAAPLSCLACNTTRTPQLRPGPDGPKALCNTCGVRFRKGTLACVSEVAIATADRGEEETEGGATGRGGEVRQGRKPPRYRALTDIYRHRVRADARAERITLAPDDTDDDETSDAEVVSEGMEKDGETGRGESASFAPVAEPITLDPDDTDDDETSDAEVVSERAEKDGETGRGGSAPFAPAAVDEDDPTDDEHELVARAVHSQELTMGTGILRSARQSPGPYLYARSSDSESDGLGSDSDADGDVSDARDRQLSAFLSG